MRETGRVRDQVILDLEAIEEVLQEADDFEAVATIQRAIGELQIGQESFSRPLAAVTKPFEGLLQTASTTGAVVATASSEVISTVATQTDRVRRGIAIAAGTVADTSREIGSSVAKSEAISTVATQADRVRQGITNAAETVVDTSRELGSSAMGAIVGAGVAGQALSNYAANLDWSTVDPTKFLYAGTRGISRGLDEARLVWETLPEQLRALGPEELSKRLDGFDWSHKVAHNQGGGTEADNGLFELASLNRARGDARMTPAEVEAAQKVMAGQAFQASLVETASRVVSGALIAAMVTCVVASLEHGLEYQRGEIDRDEMLRRIGRSMAVSAGVGATVSGVMSIVALTFPSLIPLAAPIMVPLAVIGFCAMGVKVVRLSKEWYELLRNVEEQEIRRLIPISMLISKG